MPSEVLKLVVVTPHPLEREMLVLRLAMMPQFTVCGETDNEAAAARLIDERAADLAIVDAALTAGSGLDMVKRFKWQFIGRWNKPSLVLDQAHCRTGW